MLRSFVLAAALLVLPSSAAPGWSNGNVGVDRPGSSYRFVDCGNQTQACCFNECMKDDACQAWSFELAKGLCNLKNSVPSQILARDTDGKARVASGVKRAAAEGLLPLKFDNFKLGTVKPTGWLRTQLILMTNGLSGHLELFWDDIADSVWIGGEHDHSGAGHERGPYWLNGVVPLAAHLNASGDSEKTTLNVDLQNQVNSWVYYILDHQNSSGWLGPDDGFGGQGNTYWNGWNIAAALLQYANARSGIDDVIAARCNKAVLDYILEVHRRMLVTPTSSWSQNRWQDWVYIVHWQLDQAPQGQEQALWDAAELTQQQSWDWDAYYDGTGVGRTGAYVGKTMPKYPKENVSGWTLWDHGVNNAMGTKSCSTWYRQSKNETDSKAAYKKLQQQDEFHGQPHGMFSADECFGGRDLNRGIELCAVVEQMYSLQHNFRVLGDPYFLDRYERIAYNALPGTISPDQWQHQYLQQANEVNAKYGLKQHVWQTDGADSTGFGVAPNFGCCTANINQGWSKFTSTVFMASVADKGVVVAVLAPATVTTSDGATVAISTDYPFGDIATITATPSSSADLPVYVRIPSFADMATVAVNGGTPAAVQNGTLHKVMAPKGGNTVITLDLKPQIRFEKTWGAASGPAPSAVGGVTPGTSAVAVFRGPLLYSLELAQTSSLVRTWPKFNNTDVNLETLSPWNMALMLDDAHPLEFVANPGGPNRILPFNITNYFAVIKASAKPLPGWVEKINAAPEPPASPIDCSSVEGGCGPEVKVTLVPYGSTNLRMSGFPWLG